MKKLAFILLTVLCTSIGAVAQTASVSGTVKDPNDAFLPGAQVTLRGPVTLAVAADSDGRFSFGSVPAGEYVLRVAAIGFNEQSRKVTVGGQSVSLDVRLDVGSTSVSVTAEVGSNVETRDVPQAINIIGSRQIMERANPIIAQAAQEEAGINLQRTSPTMGGIFIRGLVGTKVNVYVDGVRYTTAAQRGGVSTFFNLNEPTVFESIEILRGSNGAQYGSDALGGTVSFLTKTPVAGTDKNELHGEFSSNVGSADLSYGSAALFSYGTGKLGGFVNLAARRVNNLRTADGVDTHSAVTRFLGLSSKILGDRPTDTAFTQYGGSFRLNYSPKADSQLIFNYSRSQQDGGKRFDQTIGGDGNLQSDLRNLMLDFGYVRFVKQKFIGFDSASFALSFNSQREERVNQGGQGDPLANITHQYERTTAIGFNFFLDKNLPGRNTFLVGADIYRERVNAPAFTVNPRTNVSTLSRPRVPDESGYLLGGVFVQNSWQAIPDRLRIAGALRFNRAQYRSQAADSPIVGGFRLWGDDSLDVSNVSGRIGAVLRVVDSLRLSASYSRGFRAPSITDLGTLGLTGDGFEADFASASALGGRIGTTADASAVSTGLALEKQRAEVTNNYEVALRYGNKQFDTELTGFWIDFSDSITKQTLILPAGAVGRTLGDQVITSQNANGAVFVPLSTSPVLIRANYTAATIYGLEYEAEARLTRELKMTANYTWIRAADKATGLPPNIEGGTPPATGFVSFKYEPLGKPFWVELYSTLAARQDRLSTLDLSDRRTGATRSRTQIQNFFRRGACQRGLTNNPDRICGTGDETTLLSTGETIAQVQNRVLGIGVNSAPLFRYLPGYGLVNFRGGIRFGEKSSMFWAFENVFDQKFRNPSWGIDGAGRSVRFGYRLRF